MSTKKLFWLLLAGTLILFLVMRWKGMPLSRFSTSPAGIVSLELAKTKERTTDILKSWSAASVPNTITTAIHNTQIDFVFVLFYSLFLFTACWLLAQQQTGTLKQLSQLLAIGALKAGLLDIIENGFLLRALSGTTTQINAWLTWIAAMLKFTLLAVILVWLLFWGIMWLLQKKTS